MATPGVSTHDHLRTVCSTQRDGAAAMYADARRMAERAGAMIERARAARAIAERGRTTAGETTGDAV